MQLNRGLRGLTRIEAKQEARSIHLPVRDRFYFPVGFCRWTIRAYL